MRRVPPPYVVAASWFCALGLGAACSAPGPGVAASSVTGLGHDVDDGGFAEGGEAPSPPPPTPEPPDGPVGGEDCAELSCMPCGEGRACAEQGEAIGGTCCAAGDALEYLASGGGAEVVDVETDGTHLWSCGGFGAEIEDVRDRRDTFLIASAAQRCQRIALGAEGPDGSRLFYLTHHGDTWVDDPFLNTYRLLPDESVERLDSQGDPGVLYEGVRVVGDHLYVAAHEGGLRVYRLVDGIPEFVRTVGGLTNAIKVEGDAERGQLFVADGAGGVRVFAIGDPEQPVLQTTLETTAPARDLAFSADRLFVALGGAGVDVFDRATDGGLTRATSLEVEGSAQAVDVNDEILAVAAWSHLATYDPDGLQRLATERVTPSPSFEQDLAVALDGRDIFVGEWHRTHSLRHHPGLVAPDVVVDQELLHFDPNRAADSKVVVVRNRGYLDLLVSDVAIEPPFDGGRSPFDVSRQSFWLAPGAGRAFEVELLEPGPDAVGNLLIASNDPDPSQNPFAVPLDGTDSDRIGIGDEIDDGFGFLDPGGNVEGLRGKVVILAYFALF